MRILTGKFLEEEKDSNSANNDMEEYHMAVKKVELPSSMEMIPLSGSPGQKLILMCRIFVKI